MEKKQELKNTTVAFSIWDLGGQSEYIHLLPLVCNDAIALLFMFDLSRKSTLASVKEWYRQARLLNKSAIPFLVGTKFDLFAQASEQERDETIKQVTKHERNGGRLPHSRFTVGHVISSALVHVCMCAIGLTTGTQICSSNEGAAHFLFLGSVHQCAKNL
jgi:GTPase SAR1 family protein